MTKALEIISPDEIYSNLIFKDPVPPHTMFRGGGKTKKVSVSGFKAA